MENWRVGNTRFSYIAAKGKTHFALSMPEPVYVIDTEMGTAQLEQQFPDKDIRVVNVWEAGDDFETDPILSLRNVDLIVDSLSDIPEGSTIVIDSGTDLWEWVKGCLRLEVLKVDKTAHVQPSDYQWANSKYAAIILKLLKYPAHFCITAREQKEYSSASLDETGSVYPNWQKWTPNYVDFNIHLQKVQDDFYGVMEKCRFTRDKKYVGKSIKDITWEKFYKLYKPIVPYGDFKDA